VRVLAIDTEDGPVALLMNKESLPSVLEPDHRDHCCARAASGHAAAAPPSAAKNFRRRM
jgi:hypothetical protein